MCLNLQCNLAQSCTMKLFYYHSSYAVSSAVLSGPRLQAECRMSKEITITDSHGFISSQSAYLEGLGTHRCPYVISAQPGQRINITLWDFGSPSSLETVGDLNSVPRAPFCHKYAQITEATAISPGTVCSGNRRTKNVFLSETNRAEVRINTGNGNTEEENNAHFLLEYNGKFMMWETVTILCVVLCSGR